jgi:outer membrane protein TolC
MAETRRKMAALEYEKAIQGAFREARDGLAARSLLAQRIKAQRLYLAAQRRVLELAMNRYQSGAVSYLEVLEAQRDVFEAEMTLLDLARERLFNDLSLYLALGGGFPGEPSTLDPEYPKESGKNPSPPDPNSAKEAGQAPASGKP